MPTASEDQKAHSRDRFSKFAQDYVVSEVHAQGADLERVLEFAAPRAERTASADWIACDIATGGGHTALKIAPHVRRMISTDYAPTMLATAREFILSKGAANVDFVPADAEAMPFGDNVFDLVTCRIAAHHFPNVFKFVQEAARILKPGGRFVLQDHVLPEDKKAAAYIEAFEKLRDPSHNRALSESEWHSDFIASGLEVEHSEWLERRANLLDWAQRQRCTPDVIEHLQILLVQAPAAVVEAIHPAHAGTADAEFNHLHILMSGVKL